LKKEKPPSPKTFPYDFPVEMETRAHGQVVARCPLLPGCQAQGKTPKEALEKLKNAIDLYFASASPAFFGVSESFPEVPILFDLLEYKGKLVAATNRDEVLVSSSGAPGSWKAHPVTNSTSKFFNPQPGSEGEGDYVTQIYCLASFAPPGKEALLFAGTNLNGAIYQSADGETWKDSFSTGEDRVHTLCEFKSRLYAGTSSEGRVYAYDGAQWNNVASLSEVAVTALGVFKKRLYAGTYPGGILFSTEDGVHWEECSATGQNFIQSFKEFNGFFYAGASSGKGITLYRTQNGKDWERVYESSRELNIYGLEVFENTLFAGTGNSGRVLKSQDGQNWTTAFAGDVEGVRAFSHFGDYLYACTENGGALLRSTFDMARVPEVTGVQVKDVTSCRATLSWETDIPATSEVYFGPVGEDGEGDLALKLPLALVNKTPSLTHEMKLTNLKADTKYAYRVVSAHRSSSRESGELSFFSTQPARPPKIVSPSHPKPGEWQRKNQIELELQASVPLAGFYYKLNHYPETIPALPDAIFTAERRLILPVASQGVWYFHVVGVDEAGNIGQEASHYKVQVDTEALPPVHLTSETHRRSEVWTPNPTPVVAWETPEDLSGVKGYFVKVDREPGTLPGPTIGDFTEGTRVTLGPLEDGLWYVHVATQDKAGNLGQQAAHFALRIDTKALPPDIASSTHPVEGHWYGFTEMRVELTEPHELSGVEGYYFTLNQDPSTLPHPETSEWTTKTGFTLHDLEDGQWFLHVRTKDQAGNLSNQAAHFKVCVDSQAQPPLLSSPTHPESQRWYAERKVVLNWEDPMDHSGVEGYFFLLDKTADTVPTEKTATFTQKRSLTLEISGDGQWYFHLATKDKAGNVDHKGAHYGLKVDTTAGLPQITSPSHPDEKLWVSNSKIVFKFHPPADASGIIGYFYTFTEDEKAAPDSKASPFVEKTGLELEAPRDGIHILSVICQDAAGNVSPEAARYRVKIDTQVAAPQLYSGTHPNPDGWSGARRVELAWKEPADLSGIEGYYFAVSPEEEFRVLPENMTWITGTHTVFTLPEDGVWFAQVAAKDKAGNLGAAGKLRLRVDSSARPPLVKSSTHPAHHWVKNQTPQFTWEDPAELSGVEGYYLLIDGKPTTLPTPESAQWVKANEFSAPALKDGKWYFHIATKDKVGNLSREAAHYPVFIDTTAPKSKMTALPLWLDRTQIPVSWEAVDAGSDVACFDIQVKVGPNGPWTDWLVETYERNAVYQGQDGQRYAFRCRAKDKVGNLEPFPSVEMTSVTLDISPPPPVTSLKAFPRPNGDIELKWDPVSDRVSGTDYYRVYRWVEGEKKQKISQDGQVKEPGYFDKGTALRENTAYYYSVQAVDKMGNEQHENNQTAAALSDQGVDTPELSSSTHPPDEWSAHSSALFSWKAPADATGIAGYYHVLDENPTTKPEPGKAVATEDLQASLSALKSGIWFFHLTAKDRAGNISEPAHYRIKIDLEKPAAPDVVSTSHPDETRWYQAAKVHFQLAPRPKLSGFEAFYYIFDRAMQTVPEPGAATRTTELSFTAMATEPGLWFLHVVCRDRAGNISEVSHLPVQTALNQIPPPVIESPTHPKADEPTAVFNPVFHLRPNTDVKYEAVGYVYKLSRQEDDRLTPDDVFTSENSVELKDVAEGTWYFHVAAVDSKGRPAPLAAKRKIMIRKLSQLNGRFFRKDAATPVSGTKIELAKGDQVVATTLTDAKGAFFFSNMPEGKYEIRLHSDQYPVLRLKDLALDPAENGRAHLFVEDMGFFPIPPQPGPVRFYYFLKEDCQVTLEMFDSTGGLVDKIEERKEGGAYAVTIWDAAGKSEGEYLYKLSAKSITKNAMSRFSVKKLKMQKAPAKAAEPATI
jgi:predicted RNase H-like HicB family nuclease